MQIALVTTPGKDVFTVFFTRVGGARSLVIKISNSTKMLYLAEYSLKSLRPKTICETKFPGIQL
jgi:hypothetical protein